MNIQKFANQIRKTNKTDWNKAILAFIGFLGYGFCMTLFWRYNDILFLVMGLCILVITALEVGRYQWNRYLFTVEYDMTMGERRSLSEVTRFHAFPVNEYFAYVNKKMLVSAGLLGVCTVLIGILGAMGEEGVPFAWKRFGVVLCFAVVNGLCPFMVGIWKKKFWNYQSKMGSKGKLNLVLKIGGVMFGVVEVLFLICVVVIAGLFLWIIINGVFWPSIDQTTVVLRCYSYNYSLILFLISACGALVAIICSNQAKKFSKVVGVISIFLFLVSLGVIWAETRIYTEFSQEQIIVRELWHTKTYKLEDVKRFVIYDENDSIQMKLFMEDEETVKISGDSQTYSTLYENAYFSEYHFIADYIVWLGETGVSGEIKDVEKLQENVVDMAPELGEGLDEVIRGMR